MDTYIEFKNRLTIPHYELNTMLKCTESQIQHLFSNHSNKLKGSNHYFELRGQGIKDLKSDYNIRSHTKVLKLVTFAGIKKICRLLGNDEAWRILNNYGDMETLQEREGIILEEKEPKDTYNQIKSIQDMSNSKSLEHIIASTVKSTLEAVLPMINENTQKMFKLFQEAAQPQSSIKMIPSVTGEIDVQYYTIIGYGKLKDRSIDNNEAISLGHRCSKLSKEKDVTMGKISHARYGTVKTYSVEILEEVCGF